MSRGNDVSGTQGPSIVSGVGVTELVDNQARVAISDNHICQQREVVRPSHIAHTLDKLANLAESHSLPQAAVADDRCERAGAWG